MDQAGGTLTLVGDIGATNTRLALARGGIPLPGSAARLATRAHDTPEAMLGSYLRGQEARPEAACLAVAGPVRGGTAWMRNRGWQMDASSLSGALGFDHVELINDLQAQALALDRLTPAAQDPLLDGRTEAGAACLVLGLGTGVNCAVAYAVPQAALPLVPPSEAGCMAMPVWDAPSLRLSDWLRAGAGGASLEHALSARGLARLWTFAGGHGRPAPEEVLTACAAGEGHAVQALTLYAQILGHAARDLALAYLALGGVWLAGGLARAVAPHLRRSGFAEAFRADPLTQAVPVRVIADDAAAVLGCARRCAAL
ncbi:MAG: glucokinase [Rhodosalinus sp.]